MSDLIEREAALSDEGLCVFHHYEDYKKMRDFIKSLPPVQPETAHVVIGASKSGTTMWYMCDKCGESVDPEDIYCRQCGRRFEDTQEIDRI